MVIYNYVITRLDYCNSLCYGLPKYVLKKLQNVQNRAARLIKGVKSRDRITPALIELHWLPIQARIEFKLCLLVFKSLKYEEPRYLCDYLQPFELNTNMNVRHASDPYRLFEPRSSNKLGDRDFANCAPRLYNRLPVQLKNIENLTEFKKSLKTYLFRKSYDLQERSLSEHYKL